MRAKFKSLAKLDYNNYIFKSQLSIKHNPKEFWKFVNNRRDKNAIPKIVNFDSVSADNGQDIVNLVASYFSKAYCNSIHTNN